MKPIAAHEGISADPEEGIPAQKVSLVADPGNLGPDRIKHQGAERRCNQDRQFSQLHSKRRQSYLV